MSWTIDIDYTPDPCPHCGHDRNPGAFYGWNLTFNLHPMLLEAGLAMRSLDGLATGAAATVVAPALAALEADPPRFRAMNPANGWGDYDRLLPPLRAFLAALRAGAGTVSVR